MTKDASLSPVPASILTVRIAGKEPELKKCDITKVPKYSKFRDLDLLTLGDISKQMYTFNISGVDVYIEEGCTFVINEEPYRNNEGAILITNHGNLTAGRLKYCYDVSIITASKVFIENDLNLAGSLFKETYITSDYARMFRTTITCGSIEVSDLFEAFDASFNNTSLSGFNKVRLKDTGYVGREEFTLIGDGEAKHNLIIDGVVLPSHYQDFSDVEENLNITIQHRVDIGAFAGVKPIPFVRSNKADLVGGEVLFLEGDFWPEEGIPDEGSIYIQQLEKDHPMVMKTREMMNTLKFWDGFEYSLKPVRRSTDTEHMLVKSILVGIVSRINIYKTLEALR